MTEKEAHQHFSAACFNGVWGLLDKKDRSPGDDLMMLEMAHASLFHWLKREDGGAGEISIGLWQVSRVHSVLGNAEAAARNAAECVRGSEAAGLPPFYRGYAYEGAARAAKLAGDSERFTDCLKKAREFSEQVEGADEKALLVADLDELEAG